MRAINKSQEHFNQRQMTTGAAGNAERVTSLGRQESQSVLFPTYAKGRAECPLLAAATKKVKSVMAVAVLIIIPTILLGLVALTTSYGIESPLMVMAALTYPRIVWLMLNIQLHAGQSESCIRAPSPKGMHGLVSQRPVLPGFRGVVSHQHQIAATEEASH